MTAREIRNFGLPSVFCIADVMTVIMPCLEGVVLRGEQIKNHVTEAVQSPSKPP
jgi:hypothetical protein